VPKFVIALALAPLVTGDEFPAETWPLHLTVVPTFETAHSVGELETAIAPVLSRTMPITVVGESLELFGPNRDVRVTTVRASDELRELHLGLLAVLEPLGPRHLKPRYIGDDYRPHVSHTAHATFAPGEIATLQQAAIVDMQRRGADRSLAVAATLDLA
jgi:2'-5' RNA ligase